MIDTNSTWYNTPKDPQATVFGGTAMIDEKNCQKFLHTGQPRIWNEQSNPMDIMGRPGLFLSSLKEGISQYFNSSLFISHASSIKIFISTYIFLTCT
jgi:hypothetical protein